MSATCARCGQPHETGRCPRHMPMSDTGAVEAFERVALAGTAYIEALRLDGERYAADVAAARAALTAAAPTVEQVRAAVGEVLWNASNYPEAVQARMLGQDTGPLRDKVTDAVAALWGAMSGERCDECRHLFAGEPLRAGCWCDCHVEEGR